jgi:hypothetical protein
MIMNYKVELQSHNLRDIDDPQILWSAESNTASNLLETAIEQAAMYLPKLYEGFSLTINISEGR